MLFEFAEGIRNCTSPSPRRARIFHAQRGKDYKGNDKSRASGGGSGGGEAVEHMYEQKRLQARLLRLGSGLFNTIGLLLVWYTWALACVGTLGLLLVLVQLGSRWFWYNSAPAP